MAVRLLNEIWAHEREECIDLEISDCRRDLIDPAVFVLNELQLRAPEVCDLLAYSQWQIAIVNHANGIVDGDDIKKAVEVQQMAAVVGDRVEHDPVVPGVRRVGTDVIL